MTNIPRNPWQREGVSILPSDLSELMPLVGQRKLFSRLSTFRSDILSPGPQDLAGFFTIFGTWGVGKSRIGHEVCLEAFSEDVQWIIDGEAQRLLDHGLGQKVLPIFIRYVQVTKGPLGADLEVDNWIPSVTVEAIARLAGMRDAVGSNRMVKNQDRILELARKTLKPKGWDAEISGLKEALADSDVHDAARNSLNILKQRLGIKYLWIIVDEIEDITDVERDGLPSKEREGIDQALLTVIPRVIKTEESRQEFPEVNFLLLCSQVVGDLLKQVRAIQRRSDFHELTTNSFADVEAFFQYIQGHRPEVASAISTYPKGLKEAAFFAANRNFGWFNVIMHHAHQNHRGGAVDAPDLLRLFAEESAKGLGKAVFNLDTISDFRISRDHDYDHIVRAMFQLLPRAVGPEEELSPERAAQLLKKEDQGGEKRPLFVSVREISPPEKHRMLAHMIKCGFENRSGTELILPGEATFDIQAVLESLQTYSAIALPPERRDHLLICEDEREFTNQIKGISPYPEQADQFAPYLHGLLTAPEYSVKDESSHPRLFIGPSFSFLLEFNNLNRTRRAEGDYLRDGVRNTHLEEVFRELQKDTKGRIEALLRGIANTWEAERAPVPVNGLNHLKSPAIQMVSKLSPLTLGKDGQSVLIYATNATETDLEYDLTQLAKEPVPVVLILEDQEQQAEDLLKRIRRNVPRIAPFVIVHNITRQMAAHLIRFGLMGKAFQSEDLRTSHFHAVVGVAKEHLKKNLADWRDEVIERQGLALYPLFYGSKVQDDALLAFAKGYAAIVSGISYHDLLQSTTDTFQDTSERDEFKKMVQRHTDPAPKYQDSPQLKLMVDEGGDVLALLPRSIVTILERCGPVALKLQDLERYFLFDVPEGIKPRDVLRHITSILCAIGLLEQDGDKVVRTSTHKLETWTKGAKDWVEGTFEAGAQQIKQIYRQAGEELLNIQAKDARHRLKEAEKKLQLLSLDFINKSWEEMNRETSAGTLAYEEALREALSILGQVRSAVEWVYDPERVRAFRYSVDSLREFEAQGSSPGYPLWKRLSVLQGLYAELDKHRKALIKVIQDIRKEADKSIPALPSGEKAFPLQVLTLPLDLFRQELEFSADKPEQTIAAGGSTMGIQTMGFKLVKGKYVEALERLESIESELTQPGKLVSTFKGLLKLWQELCTETKEVADRLGQVDGFFVDAPQDVRDAYALESLRQECEDLEDTICNGGIRDWTDDREVAGTPVFQLLDGLQKDLEKVRDLPRQFLQRLLEIDQGVLPTLVELYQKMYQAPLNALTRIRRVQERPEPMWPQLKAETYGKTVAAFDDLVETMAKEGKAFFADGGETTFEVFVGFCELDLSRKSIDWNSDEYARHVGTLMNKKLLRLRLA